MKHTSQILLVDDDVALLQALPQALSLRIDGIRVDTCDSALEALKLIQEYEYDAIVSDIKMPGMDGIALALAVARDFPHIPILLMTGYADQRERTAGLESLICGVVSKPFSVAEIRAAVASALAQHR